MSAFGVATHQVCLPHSKKSSFNQSIERQCLPSRLSNGSGRSRQDWAGRQPGFCSAVNLGTRDSAIEEMAQNPGTYYLSGQTWDVGDRYTLVKVLGNGSFSSVCLAVDKVTGEKVALKRIGNVLSSPDNARKVLREVCILRRLRHPNIIALRDVFLKPSATGRLVLRGGVLVPASLDIYIGMEYADRGDLYHLKGQLSEAEVKVMMWQLLDAVKYLHAVQVWHRDIKSANVLLTSSPEGQSVILLADLGSARSAVLEGYHTAEQQPAAIPPDPWTLPGGSGSNAAAGNQCVSMEGVELSEASAAAAPRGDAGQEEGAFSADQLYARPRKSGGGFHSPLTTMVSTPCYRAPEVVMSRGGYTSALDMWSVGCIFGELLQRVPYLGKATTPHLSVAPVFAVQCAPATPREGDNFDGRLGSPVTRLELEALFRVIGTPAWACIEGVRSPAWCHYLRRLKGRAPSLFRRFGAAGETAVDLLSRLLTFDPARRATAEEALAHELFNSISASLHLTHPPHTSASDMQAGAMLLDPPPALSAPAAPPTPSTSPTQHPDLAADVVTSRLVSMDINSPAAAPSLTSPPASYATVSPTSPPEKRARPNIVPAAAASAASTSASASASAATSASAAASCGAAPPPSRLALGSGGAPPSSGCREEGWGALLTSASLGPNPAQALAEVEDKLAAACAAPDGGTERLRELLVQECDAHALQRQAMLASAQPLSPSRQSCRSAAFDSWEHLQPDPAARPGGQDRELAGEQRLPHTADTEAAQLEPEKHLRKNRHTEWAPTMPGGPRAGPSWGVSLHPPGMAEKDVTEEMMEVLRRQNKR